MANGFISFSVLNNIFNLLVTFNAASNFILYCVLSDKYRKTVKKLFCGGQTMRRNTTMSSSRFTSGRTTTSSFYSRPRNSNLFNMPVFKQTAPRFSISKDEYANLQAETAKRNRFSISTLTSPSRNNSIVSKNKEISFWHWNLRKKCIVSGWKRKHRGNSIETRFRETGKQGSHQEHPILIHTTKSKCMKRRFSSFLIWNQLNIS